MLNLILLAAALAMPWGELKMPEGTNLLANPTMQAGPDGKLTSWNVFAPGLKVTFQEVNGRKLTRFTTTGEKYHYGPVTNLSQLKGAHKYLLAILMKGTLTGSKSLCQIFYYEGTHTKFAGGNCCPNLNTSFPWTLYTMTVTTPPDYSGKCKFYPFLLTGACDVFIVEVGIYDLGTTGASLPKQEIEVTPKGNRPLSCTLYDSVPPSNVKIHLAEKVQRPNAGNAVSSDGKSITVNYKFGSTAHDAILFDLEKSASGCERFSLDVTGDGSGHRLALVLTDVSGESHLVKLMDITHKGKRHFDFDVSKLMPELKPYEISASKWGGDENMKLDLPVKKITIVLDDVPDSSTGAGTIILENIKLGVWK